MGITGIDSMSSSLDTSLTTEQLVNADKDVIGAQVVTGSLDNLNKDSFGNTNSEYEMQKKVLMADAMGKGGVVYKGV